jgi:hypothetical protein
LFLAILNSQDGLIAELLRNLGLTENLRTGLLEILQSPGYREGSNQVFDRTGKRIGFMNADEEGNRYVGDTDGKPLKIRMDPNGETVILDEAGNLVQLDSEGRIQNTSQ